jgi:uncharacterized membrane protein YgaE (UPF0421/DUF939 family)
MRELLLTNDAVYLATLLLAIFGAGSAICMGLILIVISKNEKNYKNYQQKAKN